MEKGWGQSILCFVIADVKNLVSKPLLKKIYKIVTPLIINKI